MTDDSKVDGAGGAALAPLPEPSRTDAMSLEETLARRRSVQAFAPDPIPLPTIGQLARSAQGVADARTGYRTAPSAGGTLPLEVDLLLHGVAEPEDGVYRYVPAEHALRRRLSGDRRAVVAEATLNQGFVREAPVAWSSRPLPPGPLPASVQRHLLPQRRQARVPTLHTDRHELRPTSHDDLPVRESCTRETTMNRPSTRTQPLPTGSHQGLGHRGARGSAGRRAQSHGPPEVGSPLRRAASGDGGGGSLLPGAFHLEERGNGRRPRPPHLPHGGCPGWHRRESDPWCDDDPGLRDDASIAGVVALEVARSSHPAAHRHGVFHAPR